MLWRAFNDSASVHPHHAASDANQLVITSEFAFADTSMRRRTEATAPLAIRVDRRTGRVTEFRKPRPTWSYTGTRVAIDGRGVAHLLWSEIAGVTVTDTAGGKNAVQIWTARLVGDSVSPPEFVVAAPSLEWTYYASTQSVSVDGAGNVLAVVLADSRMSRRPVMLLSLTGDRWQVSVPDLGGFFAATAVAGAVRGRQVELLFVSPALGRRTSVFGSVFHASGHVDSTQWSRASIVHDADSTGEVAQFPSLAITPSGETRAFWTLLASGRQVFGRMDLLTAGKPAGATTFQSPRRLVPRAWLSTVESLWTDACNITHLHARTGSVGAKGSSTMLEWDGRSWTEHPPLTHNWQYLGRSIATSPGPGEITRIWSSALYGPGLPMILFWYASDQRVGVPPR